jgi:DNA-binding GntR family transcriptional regulator
MTDLKTVAAHVLRHLARAQSLGRAIHLEELAEQIGVRRVDVREAVTSLHHEGHVDAQRMRLTMTGLAIAASMRECKLRSVRPVERPSQMHVA